MSTPRRIWLAACCLPLLAACVPSRFVTRCESPPVNQCTSEALAECVPLVADDPAACAGGQGSCAAAAVRADAVNREQYLDCQRRHRAAVECLRALEDRGVLKTRSGEGA